jgi:hypothetical protein
MSISTFGDFLKEVLDKSKPEERRSLMYGGTPTIGLEYNNIINDHRVSGMIYSADIARNPRVVNERLMRIDVLAKAAKANSHSQLVQYKVSKVGYKRGGLF